MSNYDQIKTEQISVEEICQLSDEEQAEIIAESFSKISNQYEQIDPAKIARHTTGATGYHKSMPIFHKSIYYRGNKYISKLQLLNKYRNSLFFKDL